MNAVDMDVKQSEIDHAMMRRCIDLSVTATRIGEFPFACVIGRGSEILVETTNLVARNADVTQHAELLAVSKVQHALGTKDLSGCTLYSNVEPCVMCSFPIREARISRVLFSITSPLMGGFSKWQVLRDDQLSSVMPEAFGPVPETVAGMMRAEAERAWRHWNPVIWGVIKHRGCFGAERSCERHPAIPLELGIIRKLMMRMGTRHSV